MKDDNGDKSEHLELQVACRVVHRYEAVIETLAKAIGHTLPAPVGLRPRFTCQLTIRVLRGIIQLEGALRHVLR